LTTHLIHQGSRGTPPIILRNRSRGWTMERPIQRMMRRSIIGVRAIGDELPANNVVIHKPIERLPPNKGLQRTALCTRKIGAFLQVGISPSAFPIYEGAAAEAQAVRRLSL